MTYQTVAFVSSESHLGDITIGLFSPYFQLSRVRFGTCFIGDVVDDFCNCFFRSRLNVVTRSVIFHSVTGFALT